MAAASSRKSLRRYPALTFIVASALLAGLLPSALRLPLSGPQASAELAPVPGRDATPGDLAALGLSSSTGLGSGSGLGSGGGGGQGADDSLQGDRASGRDGRGANPRTKNCVGRPLRQTEDPMSPPCVAHFQGDNGGATAPGVTGDEVRIVYQRCLRDTQDHHVDYSDDRHDGMRESFYAYTKHFNARYQTYGRRVQFYEVIWSNCLPDNEVAQIQQIHERYRPFAVWKARTSAGAQEAARLGMMTIFEGAPRSLMDRHAPYMMSVLPDLDDFVASTTEFLCSKLAGRPARLSGDAIDQSRTRKFGLVYAQDGDAEALGADMLRRSIAARCGSTAGPVAYMNSAQTRETDMLAQMRTDRVTTVINITRSLSLPANATATGWHPEWFVPGDSFGTLAHTMPQDQWVNAFGFTYQRRLGRRDTQPAYVAYREGCPDCTETANAELFESFVLLFWGIQAAGPRLTAANVDRGLQAIRARQSTDPFAPAAYFSPGNHSFFKDASVIWWDPAGDPPDSNTPGCYRLVEDGKRYRAEDWRKNPGDVGIKDMEAGQPCQGVGVDL